MEIIDQMYEPIQWNMYIMTRIVFLKMQKFDERRKRKLLTENIIRMEAVTKFINVSLFPIINRAYKSGRNNFLTPAEKLDYLRRFCEGRKSRNDDMIKTCHEELIRTHVSGVSYE
mgnify:CR=1 FL=1